MEAQSEVQNQKRVAVELEKRLGRQTLDGRYFSYELHLYFITLLAALP